jgi:hypothetical protein
MVIFVIRKVLLAMGKMMNRKLVEEIELMRQKMEVIASKYGLTHYYTVILSTKLGKLLNDFDSNKQ